MSKPRGRGLDAPLSPRQDAILLRLADGDTPETIAAELHLAPSTVRAVVDNCRAKLGAKTTAHAISIAHRKGILR